MLETDAPDIPPQWLYRSAEQRAAGAAQARNEPAELPRIAETLAALRGWTLEQTAATTCANAHAALPRLAALAENGEARADVDRQADTLHGGDAGPNGTGSST